MDPLSKIFAETHLRGSVMATLDLRAPWAVDFEHGVGVPVHWVIEGEAWLLMPDRPPQPISPGDVLMFPRWCRHALSSSARPGPILAINDLIRRNRREPWRQGESSDAPLSLIHPGRGRRMRLLSLVVELDRGPSDLLVMGLPEIVRVAADDADVAAWLAPVLGFLSAEDAHRRPGYAVVQSRLAELLVMQLIRATMLLGGAGAAPALRVLLDPAIRRAATAMADTPDRNWTLGELGREAGLSRSTFASRFLQQVGETPFSYLRAVRLDAAAGRLKAGEPVKAVLAGSGYRTGFSFTKAFRARFGVTPGAYARAANTGGR